NLRASPEAYVGSIEDLSYPTLSDRSVLALLAADKEGRLQPTATAALRAADVVAATEVSELTALVIVPCSEEAQRRAVSQVLAQANCHVLLLAVDRSETSADMNSRLVKECYPLLVASPRAIVGEPWTEQAFAVLPRQDGKAGVAALRIRRIALEKD